MIRQASTKANINTIVLMLSPYYAVTPINLMIKLPIICSKSEWGIRSVG
ncbi:Uncharacterised protein [Serratia rubidaea]|uniref:Uncharacterized protein n=1 Tax=Serratia rubidaea TaxID=61652 RepID=A0A447QKW5_SERRU|nr:Uncharacterised protein [Serratia rubidaea]